MGDVAWRILGNAPSASRLTEQCPWFNRTEEPMKGSPVVNCAEALVWLDSGMLKRFTGKEGRFLVIQALRDQSLIGDDAKLAEAICGQTEVIGFDDGSTIIEQSAPDNDFFFILSGELSVQVSGREIAVRKAGQHIGEMAVVDPGEPRSASVVAKSGVIVARLSAATFARLANANPRLWRNIARELAARLRQRNRFVRPVNPQPVLFVGCTAEGLPIGRAIQSALDYDPIEVKLWTDDIFEASSFPIESLEQELVEADFAALILSPDDKVISRNENSEAPRDNIVLELGLSIGALGHSRTYLVYPRDIDIKIPTDLMGITPLTYKWEPGQELLPTIAPACNQLRNLISRAGPR